jgi:chromosome segregation ATPase
MMSDLIYRAWNVAYESRNLDGEVDIISDLINEIERLEASRHKYRETITRLEARVKELKGENERQRGQLIQAREDYSSLAATEQEGE